MTRYLRKVNELLENFKSCEIWQMAREGNKTVDAPPKLALSSKLMGCIIKKVQTTLCLEETVVAEIDIEDLSEWMEEMI